MNTAHHSRSRHRWGRISRPITLTASRATFRFGLWEKPGELPLKLAALAATLPAAEALAITMTGELCDCFDSKRTGVSRHTQCGRIPEWQPALCASGGTMAVSSAWRKREPRRCKSPPRIGWRWRPMLAVSLQSRPRYSSTSARPRPTLFHCNKAGRVCRDEPIRSVSLPTNWFTLVWRRHAALCLTWRTG